MLELDPRHKAEWVEASGVDPRIVELNLESLDNGLEIAKRLGWKRYGHSVGWWVSGIDPATGNSTRREFGQFKPNQPIEQPGKDKKLKYLSPKGDSEAIFLAMPDTRYWPSVLADTRCQELITEGVKKAGAGLTADMPTIALTGVWNGQQGKAEGQGKLIPDLALFAVAGRPVCLGFDADVLTNPKVWQALDYQAELLRDEGCVVTVLQLPTETKGLDDYLVARGPEALRNLVSAAVPYRQWRATTTPPKKNGSSGGKQQRLPDSVAALEISQAHKNTLAYSDAEGTWYSYGVKQAGVWSPISDVQLQKIVQDDLDGRDELSQGYSCSAVRSICGLLTSYLLRDFAASGGGEKLLPMRNGVLDLDLRILLPHSPDYEWTWALPYDYLPDAGCAPIREWMLSAMHGNPEIVEILQAYLNAVVRGRTDLQRYVEAIGPGGSGKGTYTRLAQALVGKENCAVTDLKQLETNKHESAGLRGKRLAVITDSARYTGEVAILMAITGQDDLRYEPKHMQQSVGFRPTCMVLISANEPIQASNMTSGFERRRLRIPFNRPIAAGERRDLEKEFEPYLPGLLNWVLELSDAQVTKLLVDSEAHVEAIAASKAVALVETNTLAAWLDDKVALDPGNRVYAGVSTSSADQYLYPSYVAYCRDTGCQPLALRRFSPLLEDLCRHQLGLPVERCRDNRGRYFLGLRLRSGYGNDTASPIVTSRIAPEPEHLQEDPAFLADLATVISQGDGLASQSDGWVTDRVTDETIGSDGSQRCDGKNENNRACARAGAAPAHTRARAYTHNPSLPSNPTKERISATTYPSLPITQSDTNPEKEKSSNGQNSQSAPESATRPLEMPGGTINPSGPQSASLIGPVAAPVPETLDQVQTVEDMRVFLLGGAMHQPGTLHAEYFALPPSEQARILPLWEQAAAQLQSEGV